MQYDTTSIKVQAYTNRNLQRCKDLFASVKISLQPVFGNSAENSSGVLSLGFRGDRKQSKPSLWRHVKTASTLIYALCVKKKQPFAELPSTHHRHPASNRLWGSLTLWDTATTLQKQKKGSSWASWAATEPDAGYGGVLFYAVWRGEDPSVGFSRTNFNLVIQSQQRVGFIKEY